ncbi:hypothetical protein EJ02DRAFT_500846 [Clathrospora elynae]|uniref:Uncharacterized protein n=1 Tax=Clathrospora elynae TaxID=706981 RepID=A0A6A5T3M2_9PLEO|nr:hypothetical protein EJ02DRAFT_500846 [Clathrospora elynae]
MAARKRGRDDSMNHGMLRAAGYTCGLLLLTQGKRYFTSSSSHRANIRDSGPKAASHGAKPLFSFPLPRRLRNKVDDDARATPSISSLPPVPEWPSRREESTSKAHRVLGTSDASYRSASRQTSIPTSPGYMSITVSEPSFGSQMDDKRSATATEYGGYPKRPGLSTRPSSNILGRPYTGEDRRSSDRSSVSHRLHLQTSSSTLRSHYDAKNSPLAISQQTSDSAVRDRALRRGQPPVLVDYTHSGHDVSPLSPTFQNEPKETKEFRRNKPARLDLSKLFPKPRDGGSQNHGNTLLSPNKMVNSPNAMSSTSEYFPHPMTREPTPQVGGDLKLKITKRDHEPALPSPPSLVPKFKRVEYGSAKVHVRRPRKGVQHWFDAFDEDSDEAPEVSTVPLYASKAVRLNGTQTLPQTAPGARFVPEQRLQHTTPAYRSDTFTLEDIVDITHLTSPSQYSLGTHYSVASSKTKEPKTNRQNSSVLSFSSSEDELDGDSRPRKVSVCKSFDVNDYTGEIVIGQAQAYEVRPHRRTTSTRSTSTNAATIDIMYTPEPPYPPYHYSRNSTYSRRSSHVRQPSVIPEDEDFRPKTAVNISLSPSTQSLVSARTLASASQQDGSHKMMAVTAEEEALLEMMRKKRAAMTNGTSQVDRTNIEHDTRQQITVEASQPTRRTSAFLSMKSQETSPVRDPKAPAISLSPLLLPPRGRPVKAIQEGNVALNYLRDSSASDNWSDRRDSSIGRDRFPHYLPTPSEFSPLDPFPLQLSTPPASITSPNTIDHPSPLPSPITPGLSIGDAGVAVKVANSDTSNDLEDMPALDNSLISGLSKRTETISSREIDSRQRRRTASSDTELAFPTPPSSTGIKDLAPVSEASSRTPSIAEPPVPKLPRKNARHISELALANSVKSRSRQSSIHSTTSRTSLYSQASSYLSGTDKMRPRHMSPGHSVKSNRRPVPDDRDSVSDDVLAAWNSLGGTY